MDRYQHSATRLLNGRVLIAGGYSIESIGSVVIYDPEGVAAVPVPPLDPRIAAGMGLIGLLGLAAVAWSVPAVRLWVRRWRPRGQSEEWIT